MPRASAPNTARTYGRNRRCWATIPGTPSTPTPPESTPPLEYPVWFRPFSVDPVEVVVGPEPTPPQPFGLTFDEFARGVDSAPTFAAEDTVPTDTSRAYIPRAVRNDWRTPDAGDRTPVLPLVREALGGAIQLDPCASTEHWLAGGDEIGEALNFHEEDDGLAIDWYAKLMSELTPGTTPTVYVNPPFNQNAKWMAKCAEEAAKGLEIIALIPARVDTRYWHNHCAKATAVAFWRGRIRFVGADQGAPFPVALVYWGPNVARFEAVLEAAGHHVP